MNVIPILMARGGKDWILYVVYRTMTTGFGDITYSRALNSRALNRSKNIQVTYYGIFSSVIHLIKCNKLINEM